MKTSFPIAGRVAKTLGIYQPLHRAFIRYLLFRRGIRVRVEPSGAISLTRGDRLLRVQNWDTAAWAFWAFDELFGAVVPDREGAVRVADYSAPRWHTMARSKERYFFPTIADFEQETELYCGLAKLREGHVVLDLGTYSGTQTVAFARAVGASGRVIAFEPDPVNFRALQTNLAHHGTTNVEAINKGVWSSTGALQFFGTEGMNGSFVISPDHGSSTTSIAVVSLDETARDLGLERIDFIKIDVEGAELEVLKGAQRILEKFHPRLFIETHLHHHPDLDVQVERHLIALGYVVSWLPDNMHEKLRCLAAEVPGR